MISILIKLLIGLIIVAIGLCLSIMQDTYLQSKRIKRTITPIQKHKNKELNGYAVRYKNGQIGIYLTKPYYYKLDGELRIGCNTEDCFVLNENLYPTLKWGDEPIPIKINIQKP